MICDFWYTHLMETPTLVIDGKEYTFVKTRNQMPISIYKGPNCYLRIGPKELIQQELNYHKSLLEFGFPIPELIDEGEYLDSQYFIESSFGEMHLGQVFRAHCVSNTVSDTDFSKLLNVVKKFTEAQLKTIGRVPFSFNDFWELIKIDVLQRELPELTKRTLEAKAKAQEHLSLLPTVLTHGDFNPYNIFEEGVIDWERGSNAPVGYDLSTNIFQIFFFPLAGDYEFIAGCRYSPRQIETYWEEMNVSCASAGISRISDFANDFIFCRSVWSVVRMERWPKIQEWRYRQYEALLNAYLEGNDLTKFLLEHKV